jgi:imidazolonepropionase-like amidohydrolase
VPVILTTDEAHRVGTLRQEAGNAVRAGMDYASALMAITLRPAQAAGVADQYGTIEAGKVANLVVWSGDPLELSSHVVAVIVHGRSWPLESRQTELLERYRVLQ